MAKQKEGVSAKSGHTVAELSVIEGALLRMVQIKGTGLTYACTKNLTLIERIKKNYINETDKLNEKFLFRDDKGKVIKYATEQKGNSEVGFAAFYKKNEAGEFIKAKPEDPEGTPMADKANEEYQEALKAFNDELHEVKFHQITEEDIEKLMEENGPLDGVNIIPLFGVIIVDKI